MIGIFDSGVGGLSVLNEVCRIIPSQTLLYFADSKNIPYGEKSEDFLRTRSLEISKLLLARGAKVLVIACNTATAVAAEILRESLHIPVVAVEPPIKPAVAQCKSGVLAVIATEVTLNSPRLNTLISSYAKELKVVKRISNDLVPIVENHRWNDTSVRVHLQNIVDRFLEEGVDTVVLGSTHFSFLKESIEELSNGKIVPIGSAEATAKQVLKVSSGFLALNDEPLVKILVSGSAGVFKENFQFFSRILADIEQTDV